MKSTTSLQQIEKLYNKFTTNPQQIE